MESLSISYSSSTSPSPSAPSLEETVADADAIERWLTSPSNNTKTQITDTSASTNTTILPVTKSSRMSVADIAIRRRQLVLHKQQQQQHHRQSSPPQHEGHYDTRTTSVISPRSSIRRKMLQQQQRGQLRNKQQEEKHSNKVAVTDTVAGITSRKKLAPYRHQTAALAIKAMNNVKAEANANVNAKHTFPAIVSEGNGGEIGEERAHKEVGNASYCRIINADSNCHDIIDLNTTTSTDATTPTKNTKKENEQKKGQADQSPTVGVISTRLDRINRSGTASPGIEAIRRRRQQRQQQQELEKELQELELEEQEYQMETRTTKTKTIPVTHTTSPRDEDEVKHTHNSFVLRPYPGVRRPSNASPTATPVSPLARRPRQTHYRGLQNVGTLDVDNDEVRNDKGNSAAGDNRIFSVSSTRKIHFLKRHDAGEGGSPLSKTARPVVGQGMITIADDPSTANDDDAAKKGSLCHHEKGKLKPTLKQLLGSGRKVSRVNTTSKGDREYEHAQKRSSSSIGHDSFPPGPPVRKSHPSRHYSREDSEDQHYPHRQEQQQQQQQVQNGHSQTNPHRVPGAHDDHLNTHHHNDQNQLPQNDINRNQNNASGTSEKIERNNFPANTNNTSRLKEALARARLNRRSVNNHNDNINRNFIARDAVLQRHFQGVSLSCSSVSTTGASAVSGASTESSSKSNNNHHNFQISDDESSIEGSRYGDETTTMASIAGTSGGDGQGGEDGSQLSVPGESEAMEMKMYGSTLIRSLNRDTEKNLGSQAGTEQIQNLSHHDPRLFKHHPQYQSSEPTDSMSMNHLKTAPTMTTTANSRSALNRSGKIIPSIDVVIQPDGRNRKQDALVTSFGWSGESVISSLVQATAGGATGASSAIPKSPFKRQLSVQGKTNRIKLHVYDLVADDTQLDLWGCNFPLGQVFNAFNSSLHSIGTGAYHVGVEIDEVEYAFGANNTKGLTGVFTCMPKSSPGYQFRTTIDFGDRVVIKTSYGSGDKQDEAVDGRDTIRGMAKEYLGTDYDLLRKNCCTFARDVCIRLGISEEEIPSWFHNLAEVGAVTQDAANCTLAPIAQLFSGDRVEKFANYLNETSLDDKAIQDGSSEERGRDEHSIDDTAYQF